MSYIKRKVTDFSRSNLNQLTRHAKSKGFTLIEMLLVMVIIGIIIVAGLGYVQRRTEQMRIDKASLQTQQVLNAGLAYYVNEGKWPGAMSDLIGKYLPFPTGTTFLNPWRQPYNIKAQDSLFYVYSLVTSNRDNVAALQALEIAGVLPLSYTSSDQSGQPPSNTAQCGAADRKCNVVAAVNIPGQDLNNASAVNFAGLYHHGACVPQPVCPATDTAGNTLTPQVFVVPVSVSGVNDVTSVNSVPTVYPISSFTAYATNSNPPNTSPPLCNGSASGNPSGYSTSCTQDIKGRPATAYWRVCLQVVTQKGQVTAVGAGDESWGRLVTLLAFTRCSIFNEPAGSGFSVYSN